MADKKRKTTFIRGIVIYILLVVLSGLILNGTGHFDNPVTQIAAALGPEGTRAEAGKPPRNAMDARSGESSTTTQDHSQFDTNKGVPSDAGDPTQSHEEAESINWSRIGDLLFDVWFIAMVTAVIIVLQQVFGFIAQQLTRRQHSVTVS